MPFTNFIIVGVVCGGDLDGACSKLHINGDGVSDDRDAPLEEGVNGEFAVEVLAAVKMNRYQVSTHKSVRRDESY